MKINVNNIEKIEAEIKAAEKSCSSRKMDPEFIAEAIKRAEDRLSELLYKKDWKGVEVRIDAAGGQSFPSSYRGVPESTQAVVVFSGSGWFVTRIDRSYVSSKSVEITGLEKKKDELIRFVLEKRVAV